MARVQSTAQMVEETTAPTTNAKVGDAVIVNGTSGLVRLPDGTVVTWRGDYTPRQAGEHVFFVTTTEGTVETTVNVTETKPVSVDD